MGSSRISIAGGVNWIYVAGYRNMWRDFVNTGMNLWGSIIHGEFFD
jgi:hypothetical protein